MRSTGPTRVASAITALGSGRGVARVQSTASCKATVAPVRDAVVTLGGIGPRTTIAATLEAAGSTLNRLCGRAYAVLPRCLHQGGNMATAAKAKCAYVCGTFDTIFFFKQKTAYEMPK